MYLEFQQVIKWTYINIVLCLMEQEQTKFASHKLKENSPGKFYTYVNLKNIFKTEKKKI